MNYREKTVHDEIPCRVYDARQWAPDGGIVDAITDVLALRSVALLEPDTSIRDTVHQSVRSLLEIAMRERQIWARIIDATRADMAAELDPHEDEFDAALARRLCMDILTVDMADLAGVARDDDDPDDDLSNIHFEIEHFDEAFPVWSRSSA